LKLSEKEITAQLLDYIGKTPHLKPSRSKEKGKDIEEIIPLILPTEMAKSVSPILLAYT